MTKLEALAKDCIENHTHRLVDKPTKQDIYLREESIFIQGYRQSEKRIATLEKENAELKAEIRKMKSQHFTDIRLYTKVIGIAVEESVMNDKQNYKNYLFDKAKKILSMGVDK